jgi:8-oxo-dGTP pyrophosphatase MutT (NUDIX family)
VTDPTTPRRRALAGLLGRHVGDGDEGGALEAMRVLAADPGDVLSSDHLTPGHFTASAFVTDPDLERLLLIHHRKLGIWLQPGGHIERGDSTVLAAALREVFEETGVEARPAVVPAPVFDVDVHRIPQRGATPAHLHYDVRFHLVGGPQTPVMSAEVLDVAWVDLTRVGSLTEDVSVQRGVVKLLGMR